MPERLFIAPQINPAQGVAEKLFDVLKPKTGKADFGRSFLAAPTKNSARAIAEEFMRICEERENCACAGLEFVTPHVILENVIAQKSKASPFECIGALKKVLDNLDKNSFPALFPNDSENFNALSFARLFKRLRSLLAEAAHDFNSVCEQTKIHKIADANKWGELAEIEKLYLKELSNISKNDPDALLIEAAKDPSFLPGIVLLAGIVDAPKIFIDALKTLESRGTKIISIVVSDKDELFDEWGTPLDAWREFPPAINDYQISVCADTREQAQMIAAEVSEIFPSPSDNAALACEEGASMRLIKTELSAAGIKTFSLEGEKFSDFDVFSLLKTLENYYAKTDDNASFALLRIPLFANFISSKTGMPPHEIRLLADEFKSKKLCSGIDDAANAAHGLKKSVFQEASALLDESNLKPADILERIFSELFSHPNCVSPKFAESCEALSEGLKLLRDAEKSGFRFDTAQSIQMLLEHCDKRIFDVSEKSGGISVNNWLEIFWSSKERIFIADFNDGKVPEKIFGDALVPDSLRTRLGIRNSAFRHARDAAMLHSITAPRAENAPVRFFVPKVNAENETLQPSRLLLQNPQDMLARIKTLFAEKGANKTASAFEKSWNLKISPASAPEELSVTDFKAYIECPFKFYLERILKAKAFDPKKSELDAMQIGDAVHDAFFETSKFETLDADEIFEALQKNFKRSIQKNFGKNPPPAVALQSEGVIARLRAASYVEAAHRADGWKNLCLERAFVPLEIGGFKIKNKIDRIDVHPDGTYLIIDYKTSDSFDARRNASPAETAHLKHSKSGAPLVWKDLQLPLYRQAAMNEYKSANIACAYFTLPKNPEDTSLGIWHIPEETQRSAMECAEFIADQIRQKNFEPSESSPLVKYYADFFGWTEAEKLKDFVEVQK